MFIGQAIFNRRQSEKKPPEKIPSDRPNDQTSTAQKSVLPSQTDPPSTPQSSNTKINNKPRSEPEKSATEEAHKEVIKEQAKEDEKSEDKLNELVESSQKVLFDVKTSAPLDPFPNEIIIALDKISVIEREFFMNNVIHTYPIKDIKDAIVSTGPLWSKLDLTIEGYQGGTLSLEAVNTEDAIKARRIIQGLKICEDEGVDLSKLKEEQVVEKVEEIGKAREGPTT